MRSVAVAAKATAKSKMAMRPILKAACAAAICLALGNPAMLFAQSYPVKPIRIVVTSLKPTPLAPELPTLAESVPGYEVIGWYGLVAPARTPGEIVAKLNVEVLKALQTTEIRERLVSMGADVASVSSPQEFASYLAAQIEQARQLIRESGARPE